MSEIMRPETRAILKRWREPIIAGVVVLLGLWCALATFGVLSWLGWIAVVLGLAMGGVAVQRVLFRRGGGGPGVVTVDERRVVYYGPLTGGVVDLDALARLELEPQALPDSHWILTPESGEPVAIPVNAEGADALFDAFTALAGLRTDAMLTVLRRTPDARVTLWEATPRRDRPRLH